MDFEFAFKTLWGLATAAGWFWVNGLNNRMKELDKRNDDLRERLRHVEINYRTKAEAQADIKAVSEGLMRLENKLDKLNDKLDRKVDR